MERVNAWFLENRLPLLYVRRDRKSHDRTYRGTRYFRDHHHGIWGISGYFRLRESDYPLVRLAFPNLFVGVLSDKEAEESLVPLT